MTGKHIGVIFRKELVDNLRDRRSVLSAFITPLFMPIFLMTLIVLVGKTYLVDPAEKAILLPVAGQENAPALVNYLAQNGVKVLPAPADPQAQVRAGNFDAILVIPANYAANFQKGLPVALELIIDSSRQSAAGTISRVRGLLDQYGQQMAGLRLMARGINPQVASPLVVASQNVATPQGQTLIFLDMLPFLVVVVIFTGGMYVIIDTTAGERERGSLEPLLINPASREEFVLGKLLASLPFTLATLAISLIGFYLVFNVFPIERYTGFPVRIEPSTLWAFLWISLPMIFLASGLQMVIATFTRSFKEAQTYLALLPLVAGLPGIYMMFLPIHTTVASMLIPAFSQNILLGQILRGEAIQPLYGLLSAGSTLAFSLLLILIAIRLYQSERVVLSQ